jgi:DNA polymerase-3 subunit beta
VIGAVSKSSMPILSHLRVSASVGRITFTASDLEIELTSRCVAEVVVAGAVTIPAKKLLDITKSLAPDSTIKLKLDIENACCLVSCGRSRFKLSVLSVDEFPIMEAVEGFQFTLTDAQTKYLFDKTAFAMANQDVRYYLNGVLFDMTTPTLTVVATDGHRMSRLQTDIDVSEENRRQIILPSKAVSEIKRQLTGSHDEISFTISEKACRIEFGAAQMTTKLIDGRYPEYERVIPEKLEQTATFNKDDLRRALSRISILSNEKYKGVRLNFTNGALELQSNNANEESAEEEIALEYADDTVSIGFNVGYLADALSAMTDDTVQVQFQDSNSSSIWRGNDSPLETFVVMPMRL